MANEVQARTLTGIGPVGGVDASGRVSFELIDKGGATRYAADAKMLSVLLLTLQNLLKGAVEQLARRPGYDPAMQGVPLVFSRYRTARLSEKEIGLQITATNCLEVVVVMTVDDAKAMAQALMTSAQLPAPMRKPS
jgi:hypothetical protein